MLGLLSVLNRTFKVENVEKMGRENLFGIGDLECSTRSEYSSRNMSLHPCTVALASH